MPPAPGQAQRPHMTVALLWLCALGHLLWLQVGTPPQGEWVQPLANLAPLPTFGVAVAVTWQAARQPGARAGAGRTWRWLGLGLAAWGLGQVLYLLWDSVLGRLPFPGPPDLLYLTTIPLLAAGLIALRREQRGKLPTWGLLLDTAVVALIVADLLWDLNVQPILASDPSEAGALGLAVALAYPAGDLLLCVLLAVVSLWRPRDLGARDRLLLAAGLLLFLLADVSYAQQQHLGNYVPGTLLDAGWSLGAALMASAAFLQTRRGRMPRRAARTGSPLVPHAALLLLVALYLGLHREFDQLDAVEAALMLSIAALFLLRQLLVLIHNARLQLALTHRAEHDPLTGVRNRTGLGERLHEVTGRAQATGETAAVLFVDLDRLKTINDTFGHAVGDRVLREVASRLQGLLPPGEEPVRFGGDEFVLVVPGVGGAAGAAALAAGIVEQVGRPVQVGPETVSVSVSVGVALMPEDTVRPAQALAYADAAMYRAKTEESDTWRFFGAALGDIYAPRQQLGTRLRGALERGEFRLHFQPLVRLAPGRVEGFEALLRWESPELGWVAPGDFIPLAESREMMGGIGRWVLREALREVAGWRAGPLPGAGVSVNVSATQFRAADFVEDVCAALREAGLPPEVLTLELTESAVIADLDQARGRLLELRRLGVRVALDDFGMGYSSLGHLRHLPVDTLKIDRTFVAELAQDGAFVQAIVALGQSLRLRVVAEGIEDAATAEHLLRLGCDVGQGYFYSPPLPPGEIVRAVTERGLV